MEAIRDISVSNNKKNTHIHVQLEASDYKIQFRAKLVIQKHGYTVRNCGERLVGLSSWTMRYTTFET